MKNIHVLPTDKPSRLFLKEKTLLLNNQYTLQEVFPKGKCQNIYITSDEEIKEGDWFMSDFNSFPIHNIKELSEREGTLGWEQKDLKNNLKIILTTDPDLIKEGVQAIDDEFLEWFVKNPTCESVKYVGDDCYYEIIIPKEEPKQENCCTPVGQIKRYVNCVGCDRKPKQEELKFKNRQIGAAGFVANKIMENMINKSKQETLEEVAKKQWGNVHRTGVLGFIEGAKWQAERMYSEEEVRLMLSESFKASQEGYDITSDSIIEQFKKK